MNKQNRHSTIGLTMKYLAEKSVDFLDLTLKVMIDPEELAKDIGFTRNLHSLPALCKKIYKLKHSSYFVFKHDKLYLTEKARIEIIKNLIKIKREKGKWDKKWRAIIFDIPEAKRKERNFLRKELKWLGLRELQHSIWITPYDMKKELLVLLKLWHKDFKGDIKFLEINKISEDSDIKKSFGL